PRLENDAAASFSSRGPLTNGSLKPDIAAPGVGIVAARAAGTSKGQTVDDHYTALSGTSMATPHVSGAAAILAQEHPDWSPQRLKDALMSTSESVAGATGYEQGAGRVDIGRTTARTLFATGSVGFGFFKYGAANEPVARTVTYRNDGDTSRTLDLSVRGDNGLGTPLPAGMVTPSAGARHGSPCRRTARPRSASPQTPRPDRAAASAERSPPPRETDRPPCTPSSAW
ncbi:S8 family serine peptidase, partial [Streptomyces sp. P01-B04]|uniref:S8 family serine peptidase n=1 Tax=Streptomyces poriferorum TaxID=2798799 RepID=UPI001C5F8E95